MCLFLPDRLLSERGELRRDGRHPQSFALGFDGGLLQLRHGHYSEARGVVVLPAPA